MVGGGLTTLGREYPYLFWHFKATHLATRKVNEANLRDIFGWTRNSDMPAVYVHLSGRDIDSMIL